MKREKFTNLGAAAECAVRLSREGHLYAIVVKSNGAYVVDNFMSPINPPDTFVARYENGELMQQEANHLIHDEQREADLQKMCASILNMWPEYASGPYGESAYRECPICHEIHSDGGATMDCIQHKQDCAYVIAKDLSTNIR